MACAQANLAGVWAATGKPVLMKIDQQGNEFEIAVHAVTSQQSYKAVVGQEIKETIQGLPMALQAELDGATLVLHIHATVNGGEVKLTQRIATGAQPDTLTIDETDQIGSQPEIKVQTSFTRRPAEAWNEDLSKRLAENTYKNIQALKGNTTGELEAFMGRAAQSMGVGCGHCHVTGHPESDDKPAKATARKMILMVRAIDTQNFPSTNEVTCWTCHRGSSKPESAKPANAKPEGAPK